MTLNHAAIHGWRRGRPMKSIVICLTITCLALLPSRSDGAGERYAFFEDPSPLAETWKSLTLTLEFDPSWIGKGLQNGFRTKMSNDAPSAFYIDNFTSDLVAVVEPVPQVLSTLVRSSLWRSID